MPEEGPQLFQMVHPPDFFVNTGRYVQESGLQTIDHRFAQRVKLALLSTLLSTFWSAHLLKLISECHGLAFECAVVELI